MLDIIFQWLRTGSNPPDINLFWSDTGGKLLDWKILIPFFCSALAKFMESGGTDGAAADDDEEPEGHDEL